MMNFPINQLLPFVALYLFSGLPTVASLGLTLQPTSLVNSSSIVVWSKEQPSDFEITDFDLRFVQGISDVGLAAANIVVRPDAQFGIVSIQFPKAGHYVIKAVTGSPRFIPAGTSNDVNVIEVPANSTSTTSSKPTASPSPSLLPPGTVPQLRNVNLPAIVGGILGALILIGLLATLGVFLLRRKHAIKRRWTFHKDMMFKNQRGGTTGSSRIPSPPLPVLPLPSPGLRPEMQSLPSPQPISVMSRRPTSRTIFSVPWNKHHPDYDVEQGPPTSPKTPTSPQSMNIKVPSPVARNMNVGTIPLTLPAGAAPPSSPAVPSATGEPFPRSLILATNHVVSGLQGPRDSFPTRGNTQAVPHGGYIIPTPLVAHPKLPPPAIIRKLPQPVIRAPPSTHHSSGNTSVSSLATTESHVSPSPLPPVIQTHISTTPFSSTLSGSETGTTGSPNITNGLITTPARSRRQVEIHERMIQLAGQMKILEEEETSRALGEECHELVLEDMKKQMVWLKQNENGPWAMGTTDTPPPGYTRYMIP